MLSFITRWCWWRSEDRLIKLKTPCLDALPNDVLVDQVFFYLDVEDIISIRRVSKLYYALTHHPIIWKRFLPLMAQPLPPLPPTARHSLSGLKGLEAERLVSQAVSLNDNWRQGKPRLYRSRAIRAWWDILHMAIVPGGHYMIASTCVRGNDHYAIMLYSMDGPKSAAEPLARLKTGNKPYCLSTKYATIGGVPGVTFAYLRRRLLHPYAKESRGIDPDLFSADWEVDPAVPIVHDIEAFHVSLRSLENLERRNLYENPFQQLALLSSKKTLSNVILEEIDGEMFVVAMQEKDAIVFKNVSTGNKFTIKCNKWNQYPDKDQPIRAFHILAEQHQVLVAREIKDVPTEKFPIYSVELYTIPEKGKDYVDAVDRCWIDGANIAQFFIPSSRPVPVPSQANVDGSIQPQMRAYHEQEPAPLAIYCRTINPEGFIHLNIYPRRVQFPAWQKNPTGMVEIGNGGLVNMDEDRERRYYYPLHTMHYQSVYNFTDDMPEFGAVEVVPGASKALVMNFPTDDITDTPHVMGLWAYLSPEVRSFDPAKKDQLWADDEHEDSWEVAQRKLMAQLTNPPREKALALLPIPAELRQVLRRGRSAVAFDETIGRVCISCFEDQRIFVLDYAHAPREDPNGDRLPVPYTIHSSRMTEPTDPSQCPSWDRLDALPSVEMMGNSFDDHMAF